MHRILFEPKATCEEVGGPNVQLSDLGHCSVSVSQSVPLEETIVPTSWCYLLG